MGMDEGSKTCSKCGESKPRGCFYGDRRQRDGLRACCKNCFLADRAAYRDGNLEIVRETGRRAAAKRRESGAVAAWERANPEKMRQYRKNWEKSHSEAVREKRRRRLVKMPTEKRQERSRRQYQRNKTIPEWRLKNSISVRLNRVLKTGKYGRRTEEILGYTVAELRVHLERQFARGMNWGNYGEWHIDHIVPWSAFGVDSYDSPGFKRAWALANLRPLWGTDNVRKQAKRLYLC